MINELRKDLYLLLHKKVFLYSLIVLTFIFSYISLKDISNAYTSGYSYQHHFMIAVDYTKRSFLTTLYYLIPILVVFPFADSWLHERNMADILFTRVNKRNYFISKYVVCFLSGFLVLALPLLISFIAEMICLDFQNSQIHILPYFAGENNIEMLSNIFGFYSFYLNHPYRYILMYITFVGLYGGLCATLSFSISLVSKQKVIAYVAVFVGMLLPMFICSYLPAPNGARYIQALIDTYSPDSQLNVWVYFVWLAFFLISNAILFYLYKRRESLE